MSTYRPLEVTLISAKDLKNVNLLSKLRVYAVATISGDPRTKQRTQADTNGGRDPTWNCTLRFSIPVSAPSDHLSLDIALRTHRRLLGDRHVGSVRVPIRDLEPDATQPRFVSYQVARPSGKGKGVLNFSYKFGEPVPVPRQAEPVTAYPAYPPAGYEGYPGGYGYGGAPPQPAPGGYAYAPPQGYGYGAPAAPARGKFGMGLGAGLLGGALGGMLLGDMLSDAAAYDAGYDAGFVDAGYDGGFDDGGFGF